MVDMWLDGVGCSQVLAALLRPHRYATKMSEKHVLQGAQNIIITDSNINVADTVSEAF